ncbi:type I polyketide synthase [Streptomyces spiramyceticus]|uniref:type I polyketide synthase n=1 Tax=Streptomyces spiramyceticus TaxID=299717 RepID=UPI00237BB11C|nr:type I polyketide synthase [Streptomyces spiramyceticus]
MADPRRGPRPTDAAVVGMGAVFPGAADLAAYRRNLYAGLDAISDVPPGRWDPEVYYDPNGAEAPARSDHFYCRRGGFIDDLAAFDPTRFGIMPAAVAGAEPDQLLALRVIAEAVADAGGDERLPADRSRIGVILGRGGFMGVATARLDQRVRTAHQIAATLRELAPELGEDRITAVREAFQAGLGPERPDASIGLVPSFTAARTANRLDFRGPAYTLDAACASSLLAVEQAAGLLAGGGCDLVVAGAVHHCHIATLWSVFTQLRALSPTQTIRPFDRRADGTLLSEGTGIVLLKRLADAERDGDRIYAVVRGVGVAGDGRAASLMSPLVDGQVRALRQAWAQAGLDPAAPDALGLLEAHGTGTPVGDEAELATVARVFGPRVAGTDPVAMGSVKSMLGHTMQASGMAGLIKAVLAVYDGTLPPTLHLDEPHEGFARTRMRPVTAEEPWERGRAPRRAGVNAFGFGGINAHVVLEEAPGGGSVPLVREGGPAGRAVRGPATETAPSAKATAATGELPGPVPATAARAGLPPGGRLRAGAADPGTAPKPAAAPGTEPPRPAAEQGPPDGTEPRNHPGNASPPPPPAQGPRSQPASATAGQAPAASASPGPEASALASAGSAPAASVSALAVSASAGQDTGAQGPAGPAPAASAAAGSVPAASASPGPEASALASAGSAPAASVSALAVSASAGQDTGTQGPAGPAPAVSAPAGSPAAASGSDAPGWVSAVSGPTASPTAGPLPTASVSADPVPEGSVSASAVRPPVGTGPGAGGLVLRIAAATPRELLGVLEALPDRWRASAPLGSGGPCRLALFGAHGRKQRALAAAVVARGKPWRGRGGVWFAPRPLLAGDARLAFLFPGLEPELAPCVDGVADHFGLPRPALTGGGALVERAVDAIAVGRFFARVLPELGIRADLLAGHSLGEWTAMVVAGMYPQQAVDTFLDSLRPGDLDVPDLVYAALGCGARQAADALRGLDRVAVSHDNCPHQSVLCGEPRPVADALIRLAGQGVLTQELPFRSGFHTPMWAPYLDQVRAAFARLPLRPPTVPVWSATTCALYPGGEHEVRDVVLRHLLEPVRFRELTSRLYAEGVRAFVQMGPGSLPGFVADTLHGRDHLAVSAGAARGSDGLNQLRRLAAALWTEGLDARWDRLTDRNPGMPAGPAVPASPAAPRPRLVRLDLGSPLVRLGSNAPELSVTGPSRPPAASSHALVSALDAVLEETQAAARSVAEAWRAAPALRPAPTAPQEHRTRRQLSLETMPYVRDHCVYLQPDTWPEPSDRFPVVPMTTLLELAADAARQLVPGRTVAGFDDVRALRWLAVAPPVDAEINAFHDPSDSGRVRVEIAGCATVTVVLADRRPARPAPDPSALTREAPPPVSAEALYRDRWMFHGPAFAGVREVTAVADDGIRGVLCALPAPGALLDAAGQLLGHWMQLRLTVDRLVFPASLERVRLYGPAPRDGALVRATARIRAVRPGSVLGDVELTHGDGTVLARLEGWTYRRFAADERVWPMKFTPEICGIGEPQPGGWCLARRRWTDPASQELVMRRYLGAAERAAYEQRPPRARAAWLLGRIAAKDAIRRLLWERDAGPVFPAEVPVGNDDRGRPRPEGPLAAGLRLSLAHKDRLAVAYAQPAHTVGIGIGIGNGIGIDVETVTDDPAALSRIALTADERRLAEELAAREGTGTAQALTALWCAKEAAAKAEGTGLGGRLRQWTVTDAPAGLRVTSPEGRSHAVRISTVHDLPGPGDDGPTLHVVARTVATATATATATAASTTTPATTDPTEASHGI